MMYPFPVRKSVFHNPLGNDVFVSAMMISLSHHPLKAKTFTIMSNSTLGCGVLCFCSGGVGFRSFTRVLRSPWASTPEEETGSVVGHLPMVAPGLALLRQRLTIALLSPETALMAEGGRE